METVPARKTKLCVLHIQEQAECSHENEYSGMPLLMRQDINVNGKTTHFSGKRSNFLGV